MSATTAFGDFGTPPDAIAWIALLLAVVLLVFGQRPALVHRLMRVSDRRLVAFLAICAAALSVVYVAVYLRGGPRIIDATTYYLQARALSEGHIAFAVPSPSAAFRGRFLVASPDGQYVAGILPPGYPAILALGFLVGEPLLVGPLIAAALVVVTYALARRVSGGRRDVALLAAALSTICAVLRYHTADTMSHGWSALLFALAMTCALGTSPAEALAAGVAAGWLFATRPVTGALGVLLVALAVGRSTRRQLSVLAGALGPCLLFAFEQRAATGAWLRSSQAAYYALADGPEGCFRYGFGPGVGCVFEHGDFVRAHLAGGYGLLAAAGTTLRRLKMHLADAGNCELFAPLVVYAAAAAIRDGATRILSLALIGVVVFYVPFYFDGNYPGGGARFYADALPFEHVLLSVCLLRHHLARFALPAALAGFALHGAYDHERLAEREGGRPMFEAAVLRGAGVEHGLVFVDTDHGFDLGHDPAIHDAQKGVVVARRRRDAHDDVLWTRLGRPPAFAYELSTVPHAPEPRITPLSFRASHLMRFEAEAEWPPLEVSDGWAEPVFPPCASSHRGLSLHPTAGRVMRVRLEALVPKAGKYRIASLWVTPLSGQTKVEVTFAGIPWSVHSAASPGTCVRVQGPIVEMRQVTDYIDVTSQLDAVADAFEIEQEEEETTTFGGKIP